MLALLFACAPSPVPLAPPEPGPPLAAPTGSPDWTVDCEGGGDFDTIGEAIDAASDGDLIAVEPCTYAEQVDFRGKSLWIASTAGPEETVIDARGGVAVVAQLGEGDGTALVGFTIENGGGGGYGVVYASLAALRLEDVVIRDSSNVYAMVWGSSADIELQGVSFDDVGAWYGSVALHRGSLLADDLSANCDGGSYAVYVGHASFFVDHSELDCPRGYALYNGNAIGRVHRSTLRGDYFSETDEDHYDDENTFENVVLTGDVTQTYGAFTFRNSIALGGTVTLYDVFDTEIHGSVFTGSACALAWSWSGTDTEAPGEPELEVTHNDFHDVGAEGCDGTTWSGTDGNIAVDPMFTDAAAEDWTLQSGSPLVDAGPEEDGYEDPDGTRNDIGVYGGPRSMGGGW